MQGSCLIVNRLHSGSALITLIWVWSWGIIVCLLVWMSLVANRSRWMIWGWGGSWWQLQTQSCAFLPSHIRHWLRKHLAEAGGGFETKKHMRQVSAALIGGKRRVWLKTSTVNHRLTRLEWNPWDAGSWRGFHRLRRELMIDSELTYTYPLNYLSTSLFFFFLDHQRLFFFEWRSPRVHSANDKPVITWTASVKQWKSHCQVLVDL